MPAKSPAKSAPAAAAKSPAAGASKDVVIKGPAGPSWDSIRALAAGKKGDAAAAASQCKSFLSNPALPTLTGQTAASIAKLAGKAVAGAPAAVFKEVLALSDAAVAKLSGGAASGGAAPAGGKKVLDVAALVAELCVGVGTAFAPDAIEALEKAARVQAAGAKPAKKAAKKPTQKVRRFPPPLPPPSRALPAPPPLFRGHKKRAPRPLTPAPLPNQRAGHKGEKGRRQGGGEEEVSGGGNTLFAVGAVGGDSEGRGKRRKKNAPFLCLCVFFTRRPPP